MLDRQKLLVDWRKKQIRLGKKIGLHQGDLVEIDSDAFGYPKKNQPLVVDVFTEMGSEVWVDVVYLGMPLMIDPNCRDPKSQHLPIYKNWKIYKGKSSKSAKRAARAAHKEHKQ